MDLILDGTDNVETRFLLNDVAVKHGIPWVYGACVGTEGRVMPVRPPATACLRCVFPEPPGPGELPTCDTAGVLGPAAGVVACMQAVAAIKLTHGATGTRRGMPDHGRRLVRTVPTDAPRASEAARIAQPAVGGSLSSSTARTRVGR